MSESETKNLQTFTSGPLRLALLKRDPVPSKLLPAREAWTLLVDPRDQEVDDAPPASPGPLLKLHEAGAQPAVGRGHRAAEGDGDRGDGLQLGD